MALILSIDAATTSAKVCLGNNNTILTELINTDQKDHAAFVQPAIETILKASGHKLSDVEAIAVSAGPGSYTGLRVGLASAKGICYALNKPLIMINTLKILAADVINEIDSTNTLICPMIDARRMEVFATLYTKQLDEVMGTEAFILTEPDFLNKISQSDKSIVFTGNGVEKWKEIAPKGNFTFLDRTTTNTLALNSLAQQYYELNHFADIAYSDPLYFKAFYTTAKVGKQ